jgi:hypothetical protein
MTFRMIAIPSFSLSSSLRRSLRQRRRDYSPSKRQGLLAQRHKVTSHKIQLFCSNALDNLISHVYTCFIILFLVACSLLFLHFQPLLLWILSALHMRSSSLLIPPILFISMFSFTVPLFFLPSSLSFRIYPYILHPFPFLNSLPALLCKK